MRTRTFRVGVTAAIACLLAAGGAWFAWPHAQFSCMLSSTLVPTCGALWGVATEPRTEQELHRVEQVVGTRFDMVYRFHDLNDVVPTPDERTLVRDGRVLHIAIDGRIYGSARVVTWAEIARGDFDTDLARQARGIASLKKPVFVTFEHEQDRNDKTERGTHAQFVAAWRHVHELYARNGAHNAVWVWVVTGYPPFFAAAAATWPGNRYVDWISWEAYNASGCTQSRLNPAKYQSFSDATLPFYHWVHDHGAQHGIDAEKPMMISEAGSVVYDNDPALTAQWYREIPQVLSAHPQIRAIALWDRPGKGSCDYRFDGSPTVSAAIAQSAAEVQYHDLRLISQGRAEIPVSPEETTRRITVKVGHDHAR